MAFSLAQHTIARAFLSTGLEEKTYRGGHHNRAVYPERKHLREDGGCAVGHDRRTPGNDGIQAIRYLSRGDRPGVPIGEIRQDIFLEDPNHFLRNIPIRFYEKLDEFVC